MWTDPAGPFQNLGPYASYGGELHLLMREAAVLSQRKMSVGFHFKNMDVILTGWDLGACVRVHVHRDLQPHSTVALIKNGLGAAFLSKRPGPPRSNSAAARQCAETLRARVYRTRAATLFLRQAQLLGFAAASRTGVGDICETPQKKNVGITARSYCG